jgi:hypothetical protein
MEYYWHKILKAKSEAFKFFYYTEQLGYKK